MKQVNLALFKAKMSSFIEEVFFHHERYVIMKNGKRRAVVMSIEEYEALEEYIRDSDKRREVK